MNACAFLLAAVLVAAEKGGVELKVESETSVIDPAKSVFLRVETISPQGKTVSQPDLRSRVKGFSLAEEFADEPVVGKDGRVTQVTNWRLVPEPCAAEYRVRPFVVGVDVAKGGAASFIGGPIDFEAPPPREAVTGGMEIDPKKDLPPLSWKLVGWVTLALAVTAAIVVALVWLVRYVFRRVKEHRMSPIERAWVELDRLLRKGLPGRGRYKDFYVELTMVVRRYIQRKYGIRAPHLTTEEFLRECSDTSLKGVANLAELKRFLESADMVKFAGVEATPEMADGATDSARGYLKSDATTEGAK